MTHHKKNFFKNFSWFQLLLILIILTLLGLVIWAIVYQVREKFGEKYDEKIIEIRKLMTQVHPITDKLQIVGGKKSFTVNKQFMTLCLKDENDEYYSDNMLMYVALHELAHVLCSEIGHTDKFHAIFDSLLEKAESKGFYDPNIQRPSDYCNTPRHNK